MTRRYPFTERMPTTVSTSNNLSGPWVDVTPFVVSVTTYKPNPFHGIDRWAFALDEWGHRNLPSRAHRVVLGRLCDWWERRLAK